MPRITIFYTHIPNHIPTDWFEHKLQKIPILQQNKIKRYIRPNDAYASLLGKLILLKQLKNTAFSLADIQYNLQNRPYFLGDADFNISHAHHYVICAFCADGKLGIDIEAIKPIELKYFQKQWTASERQIIENQSDMFYYFWTRKEAIIKANGKGMALPLNQFSVQKNEVNLEHQTWFLYPINVPQNYIAHLAFDQKISPSEIVIKELFYQEF